MYLCEWLNGCVCVLVCKAIWIINKCYYSTVSFLSYNICLALVISITKACVGLCIINPCACIFCIFFCILVYYCVFLYIIVYSCILFCICVYSCIFLTQACAYVFLCIINPIKSMCILIVQCVCTYAIVYKSCVPIGKVYKCRLSK